MEGISETRELMDRTLVVRTDGSSEMGTGHIMRCLTLAQAWCESGGTVNFVSAAVPDGLRDRILEWAEEIVSIDVSPGSRADAEQTSSAATDRDADWVVVDGPQFNAAYQDAVSSTVYQLLNIDDMGNLEQYSANLVLNQNLHAASEMYADRAPHTELLLGPDYVLLRNEFLEWQDWSPDVPTEANHLLVTLGGSDPDNATQKVLDALDKIAADLEVVVVAGAENDYYDSLRVRAETVDQNVRIERNIDNMAEQMAWADFAVSSGGTTCWELAFMGVPTLVGMIAQVEECLVSGLQNEDLFRHFGYFSSVSTSEIATEINGLVEDTEYRRRMSSHAQDIIDGYGRERVVEELCGN